MLYFIILILVVLAYLFIMPKDIRRSIDIYVLAALGVLILAVAISQAVMNQSLILEIVLILVGIGLTIRAWLELEAMGKKKRRNRRR